MKIIKGILALLPLAITAAVIPFMPDTVPMHYDINGNVSRYGSRYELMLMPLLIILVMGVSAFTMKRYTKLAQGPDDNRNVKIAKANLRSLRIISLVFPVIFGVLQCYILYKTYRNAYEPAAKIDSVMFVRVANILIGVMCVVFGNMMPKIERNNLFGFRTAWSMYNDNTWAKCNRLGGIFFVVIGLLIIVTSAIVPPTASVFFLLGYLFVGTVILTVCSYRIYKAEKALENPSDKK